MGCARRRRQRFAPGLAAAGLAFCGPAFAQEAEDAAPEIVITGDPRSAAKDLLPLTELDVNAVAATGATTMSELLQSIRGTTQAADGSEPIFLLNGQRVSGYQEIGALPPEAIEKVEVLPEQAALRYGFPPTRRVVNFITKPKFRQLQARASAGTATRGGSTTQGANLGLTRLDGGRRLTLGLDYKRTDPLYQSSRDIAPDPQVPFDAIGNVTGITGGEVDPLLSAQAEQVVTIAPVPDDPTLAGFAAGANRTRLFDQGPYATLAPGNETIKAEAVISDKIGATLSGSLSLSAEQSRERSLGGLAAVRLIVPETNPASPFSRPVVLNRYLTETGPLRSEQKVTTLHAGATLRGAIAGWRWDLTGNFDQKQTDGRNELGIDTAAANGAIAAGADPFAELDPALFGNRLTDRVRLRTRTMGAKAVATNTPFRLPAGRVTVTGTIEAEQASAFSRSRGPNPSELDLSRGRIEAGLAVDLPLTSRREGFLPFLGELSANASVNIREVGGFGALRDSTWGLAWGPFEGVQLLATLRESAAAPDMEQQLAPVTRIVNVPVFDFGNGRTELVTLIQGGNPNLLATRRTVRSLSLNVKPFAKRELRLAATYEVTTIRDQTDVVRAITPQTEALLPDLFVRDASGRLVSVEYRPINFAVERLRVLNFTLNANGRIGKPPLPPKPGAKGPPPQPANYYGGIGPSIKFSDRLQLRPGTPELDLIAGDTVRGWGVPRVYGYAYGGINYRGSGITFNGWYQAPNRVRSTDPTADLRFSSLLKLNLGVYAGMGGLLPRESWARGLRIGLDIGNVLDSRQRVTDRNGAIPNRFQTDYLDPIGRTATLTLRKLF